MNFQTELNAETGSNIQNFEHESNFVPSLDCK